MKIVAVIPARYASTRFPGKPLADICGRPMIWWVYNQVKKVKELSDVIVATDDERIANVCKSFNINFMVTSPNHNTPTSRIYEVSQKIDADFFIFVGGDEPLINSNAISKIAKEAMKDKFDIVHAMTTIKHAPEVIDYTNIKITTNSSNILLYTTRSPIPFPKGGLNFKYKKFVGIGAFSKNALNVYDKTKKSQIEKIEECDLLRFVEKGIPVKMINVNSNSLSVDTPKDLEFVKSVVAKKIKNGEIKIEG